MDPHYQACAVIEQILRSELPVPNTSLGEGDIKNPKRKRTNVNEEITTPRNVLEGGTPGNTPDRDKPTFITKKWKKFLPAEIYPHLQKYPACAAHLDFSAITESLLKDLVS